MQVTVVPSGCADRGRGPASSLFPSVPNFVLLFLQTATAKQPSFPLHLSKIKIILPLNRQLLY